MAERPLATVGGLIIAPDGQILLVQSKKWSDLYSLPGGKVEWGERREEAFQREVWEETHLKIINIRFAIVQDSIFSPEFWQKRHFIMNDFLADLDPTCSKEEVILNDEAYGFRWIEPQQALQLALHRECRILIEWYIANIHRLSPVLQGILGVHQHQISCIIGVYPEERLQEQTLLIDIKVKVDLSKCVLSKQMQDSFDYEKLTQICTRLAYENKYALLEIFAADVLEECIEHFNVLWAWVRIQKPSAISTAKYAYVELERYR